jgi:archaellin
LDKGGYDWDENFNSTAITDSDDQVLGKRSHRVEVNVTLEGVLQQSSSDGAERFGGQLTNLEEGEEVQLTLTLQSGAQRTTVLQVPDSLSSESNGDDVRL